MPSVIARRDQDVKCRLLNIKCFVSMSPGMRVGRLGPSFAATFGPADYD